MTPWQRAWRVGFAPGISTDGLKALMGALFVDDPRVTQGITTTPPPMMSTQDCPVEAADAIGFCGWQGDGLSTAGEVEEYFAKACYDADHRLGEEGACRWFVNWFDNTPRNEMRRLLMDEIIEYVREVRGT